MGGRGRRHAPEERLIILEIIDEAVGAGARREYACAIVGIDRRTEQRWRRQGGGVDRRKGRQNNPSNKLTIEEQQQVIETTRKAEFRGLSPKQIVPRLADQGVYLASESTFYRYLHRAKLVKKRMPSRKLSRKRPGEFTATGPNQVWSWDITYLRSPIRGAFYYLYLIEDVWSRMIVGYEVHELESMELSAELIEETCRSMKLDQAGLVLHSDNGGPMRGSTMLATLQRLNVVPSFSRPRVSDDNAYSESLFKTLKYRPGYPSGPFESLDHARAWVDGFVRWYNNEHLHSGINYVTPASRHHGLDRLLLANRKRLYLEARRKHPERWTGRVRNWMPVGRVRLNPSPSHRNDGRRTDCPNSDVQA